MANSTYPADFLSDNLRIQLNVLDAALTVGVERLLFLGSSCIYPKFAPQPISEDSFLTGPLEPTNDAYAIAKIAGVMQVQAMRRQHGVRWVSAMPTNLYGPGDNFDPQLSHVLPAMIRRFHEAKVAGAPTVLRCGAPARRAASSCTSTIWPGRASWCSSATTTRRRSTSAWGRPDDRGAGRTRRRASSDTTASGCSTRANPTARRASCSTCTASTRSGSRRRSAWPMASQSTYDWYLKHADSVGVVA